MEAVKTEDVHAGIDPVRLSKGECETKIKSEHTALWANHEDEIAIVQTHDRAWQKQLKKLGIEPIRTDESTDPPLRMYYAPIELFFPRQKRRGNPNIGQYSHRGVLARQKRKPN
jgi:hypothetical protein